MRAPLLLVAACLVLFFTGLGSVPFYTRGEPREALVAREMIRTGEWLVPARPDGELTRKPPLFYWAAATSLTLLPERPELAARLPSALLATAGVLVTWAVVQASFGAAIAFPAALVLATSLEWIRAATVARVDMALVAGLTLLFGAWLRRPGARPSRARTAVLRDGRRRSGRWRRSRRGRWRSSCPRWSPASCWWPDATGACCAGSTSITVLLVGGAVAGLWYVAAFAKHGWAFFDIVAKENWLRYIDTRGRAHRPLPRVHLSPAGRPGRPAAVDAAPAPRRRAARRAVPAHAGCRVRGVLGGGDAGLLLARRREAQRVPAAALPGARPAARAGSRAAATERSARVADARDERALRARARAARARRRRPRVRRRRGGRSSVRGSSRETRRTRWRSCRWPGPRPSSSWSWPGSRW